MKESFTLFFHRLIFDSFYQHQLQRVVDNFGDFIYIPVTFSHFQSCISCLFPIFGTHNLVDSF